MNIRKASLKDLDRLMEIFGEARTTIAALGIDQWQGGYPEREVIAGDIELSRSYLAEEGTVYASFAVIDDGEPTYDKIYEGEWKSGNESKSYLALHRVAISVAMRGKGISRAIIEYSAAMARALGRESLRIDTHRGNIVMRRMLEKNGFVYCGIIYLANGDERVAYEKIL